MKYEARNEIRKAYQELGRKIFEQTVYTDSEVITILHVLDIAIGLHDGLEGTKSLTSYALIRTHQNFLNMARMRGIVNE